MIALLLLLPPAACDSGGGSDREDSVPSIASKGPDEVVLQVHTGGGFVPVEVHLGELPRFSLYGDGRVITMGPQIAIYPGPALPNLLVRQISEGGVAEILEEAQKAGLTGPDRNFDQAANFVTDLPTTTFTLSTDTGTHETSAYAIDFLKDVENLSREDREAVEALLAFDRFLADLEDRLPGGSIGKEEFYKPDELRLYVTERASAPAEEQPAEPPPGEPPPEEPEQQPMEWPLPTPLGEFGKQAQPENFRCGTVTGSDLAAMLVAAEKANQLTPWMSAGKIYTVVFRPLLPDESGCEPVNPS